MNKRTAVFTASVTAAAIALGLAALPKPDPVKGGGELPAFRHNGQLQLSDSNLVDWLAVLPLELDLRKVELRQSVLAVDLRLSSEPVVPELVYRDLYELTRLAFRQTSNVKRVLVRVLAPSEPAGGELLLAMDAKRENASGQARPADTTQPTELTKFLQAHYSVTYTRKWNDAAGPKRPPNP